MNSKESFESKENNKISNKAATRKSIKSYDSDEEEFGEPYEGATTKDSENEINTVIDYFRILYSINGVKKKQKKKNVIDIDVFGVGVDLSKDNDEIQSYLNLGYNTAKKHNF